MSKITLNKCAEWYEIERVAADIRVKISGAVADCRKLENLLPQEYKGEAIKKAFPCSADSRGETGKLKAWLEEIEPAVVARFDEQKRQQYENDERESLIAKLGLSAEQLRLLRG